MTTNLCALLNARFAKGDLPGHPFRGNQYIAIDGGPGMRSYDEKSESDADKPHYRQGYEDAHTGYGWQKVKAGRKGSRQHAAYSRGYAHGGSDSGDRPVGKTDLAGLLRKAIVDDVAHDAATTPLTPGQPSRAQLKAGNYAKGHVRIAGMDISIENPQGSARHGCTLSAHYGYIRRTEGADGDHLDVFVKPGTPGDYDGPVFVIDQHVGGKFDEHKVMLGWDTEQAAGRAYLASYQPGWKGLRAIQQLTLPEFKEWMSAHACKCCSAEALLKAAPMPPSKKYVLAYEDEFAKKLAAYFEEWAGKAAALIVSMRKADLSVLIKGQSIDNIVKKVMAKLIAQGYLLGLIDTMTPDITAAAKAGGLDGLAMINLLEDKRMVELVPERAVAFARERAGELVGMRYDEDKGRFVTNTATKTSISSTTREGIRRATAKALEEGWGVAEIKKALIHDYTFSKTRAAVIARTELATAHVQGSLQSWKSSGVVKGKRWLLADTHPEEDECDDAELEDTVPLDAEFAATGTLGPPAHPNCLCALAPVVESPR